MMDAGHGLEVMVVGADGDPAAGVHVTVVDEADNVFQVRAGQDGLATIQGLDEGTVQVTVRNRKYGQGQLRARLEPAPGPRVSLSLEHLSEARIVGRVELRGHELGAGIRVVARGIRNNLVTPDPEGNFELVVAPGDYDVYAHFGLRVGGSEGAPSSEEINVSVEEGQEAGPLSLVLTIEAAELTGRVESDDGSPVADALIRIRARDDPYFRRETLTEAGGDFSLDRLVAGVDYDIDVSSPDGRRTSAKSLRPDSQRVVLRLPPTKRVCGDVVDGEGKAIRDFEITLFEERGARSFHFANEEGSWCLPEVGHAHRILVTARGKMVTHAPPWGHLISEFSGSADDLGIHGVVVDSEGKGLPGAMLWLLDPISKRLVGGVTFSKANGSFGLAAPSDTLLLHVAPPSSRRHVMKELTVTGNEQGHEQEQKLVITLDAAK